MERGGGLWWQEEEDGWRAQGRAAPYTSRSSWPPLPATGHRRPTLRRPTTEALTRRPSRVEDRAAESRPRVRASRRCFRRCAHVQLLIGADPKRDDVDETVTRPKLSSLDAELGARGCVVTLKHQNRKRPLDSRARERTERMRCTRAGCLCTVHCSSQTTRVQSATSWEASMRRFGATMLGQRLQSPRLGARDERARSEITKPLGLQGQLAVSEPSAATAS